MLDSSLLSSAGVRGFRATSRLFGSVEAHKSWFASYGAWCAAKASGAYYWQIKFKHPGPHPSWSAAQSQPCSGCGVPVRDCICHNQPF